MFKITIISFIENLFCRQLKPSKWEEVRYLLNNTVVARLLVQPGFTEVNHDIREEAREAGDDEKEADHDDPGQGQMLVG